jgi:NitT/TauT family transport system ATP-binding protein
MILVEDVSKTYTSADGAMVRALRKVSMEVKKGEFVSIVGASGCGKTTLLSIMTGLIKPTHGRVLVNQVPINGRFGWAGYMTQTDTLLPWRTVKENAEIGLEIRGVPKPERQKRVEKLISQVGLNGFENKYPFEISGGMKKRLGIIRILAYDPDILFLDEPFAALDAQTREFLHTDILRLWRDYKKTIVFVTHDLVEAITLSDRIFLMTSRPGTIKKEYRVPLARPRSTFDLQITEDFYKFHKLVRNDLKEEVIQNRSVHQTGNRDRNEG